MAETQANQTALERTKELTDRLEAGIQDLLQSDKYKEYLKSMSQFHRYSTRNTLLIHIQNPNATRVASFKKWQNDFNRQVKKGEKSIRIFAPIVKKEKREFDKIDPVTQTPMLDKDGKVITEELESESLRFKLVPVFDVGQTYGEPLPEIIENLAGDVTQYEAFLDTLREVSTLPIEFEPLPENTDGYCRYGEKIGIREGMSEVQTISAVVHEITHAKLHDREKAPETATDKSRKMKEVEAESISYVVCQHFGIETSSNSFGYLAEWGSEDLKEFKASLDTIRKESNDLINAIDERFEQICKDRGIDLSENEKPQAVAETTTETPTLSDQPAEPTYTTETRTENIAGVDFAFTDIVPDEQEEVYQITYWQKGSGTDVLHYFNEGDERHGDYETLAHIAPDRSVEFVKTDLSAEIMDKIKAYAETAEIPNMMADVVKDNAAQLPKETRPVGNTVLMPLLFNNDGNFERTDKRTKVKIEPPIGKHSVYSREISGMNDPYYYLLTDSGRLVSIYGAGRYGGQMPDTVTEESIDTYFAQAKEECNTALLDPDAWVDFTNAAIADRLNEADAHNQPIRESREAARAEKAQKWQAEYEAKEAKKEQNFNARVDDIEKAVVSGDKVDTTVDRDTGKNPLFALLDRHGVDLPLATKGWVNRNLQSMQVKDDGVCSMWLKKGIKPSHTFASAMQTLKDKIVAQTQTAELPNTAVDNVSEKEPTTNNEPTEILPDPSISISERDSYGYSDTDMLPLRQDKALALFDADHTIYMLYNDNTEAMAFDRDEIITFAEMNNGIFGIAKGDWENTAEYAELSAQASENIAVPEQTEILPPIDSTDSKSPPPEVETPISEKPIYRETYLYASENNEFGVFHQDKKLNDECRNAIDKAINDSQYDTNHYKMKDAVKQVVDEYGSERVELLMAKIVQGADWDGRYSRQNKEWAKGFDVPESMKDIYSNTHPCLLDGFLNKVREKPSVLEALKTNTKKSHQQSEPKQDTKKPKEMEM